MAKIVLPMIPILKRSRKLPDQHFCHAHLTSKYIVYEKMNCQNVFVFPLVESSFHFTQRNQSLISDVFFRYVKYSRRQWDGLIKAWKLQIHAWNARNDFSIGEWESVTTGNDVTKEEDEIKKEDLNEVKEDGEDEEEDLKEPVTKFNWCDEIEEEEEELLKRRKT